MSFSRSTVTRIAFPSPATVTPGPGAYDVRTPRAFAATDDNHHTLLHPMATNSHNNSNPSFHSPPPSLRARRMSSPCSAGELQPLQPSSNDGAIRTPESKAVNTVISSPLAASPCSSPSLSPLTPAELTSSAQKRRLARQAQRGIALQPLPPIVTSPEVLRDQAREQHSQLTHSQQQQQQQRHVSPTATTAAMVDESAVERMKTAVTATPLHAASGAIAPSSCRRFRFAAAYEGGALSSPAQQPHPITALSHSASHSPSAGADGRIQRLEEKCRELEEAKRRSHAAWMEELSSQALLQQQLVAQRHTIEQLERQTAALTEQRDTHATRVQQLQAEMHASVQRQMADGGRLAQLHEQHMFLDEVSEQQSAAITALKADVVAKEQQLAALQSCLDAERRRYEELLAALAGTQTELRAVLQDKEQLVMHMDALERQVDEAAAREQHKTTQEREANSRIEAERRQLTAKWEQSESERQQLLQQTRQLQADMAHWQHKYQNEADSHTALQHQHALSARQSAAAQPVSSPGSVSSAAQPSEQKEERVSRLAAVRRQLTEMRDSISQRLAAIRPVKRKDARLLELQAELERSEAEMERLLKEHESTWQQVNRARRERCLSCGTFHHHTTHRDAAAATANQRDTHSAQQPEPLNDSNAAGVAAVDSRDELLSEMSMFNTRLRADNTALRQQVEALTKERDEALARTAGRRENGASSASKTSVGSGKSGRRDKRARDGDDKENEAVLQMMDVNVSGDRKHRRSMTAGGSSKSRRSTDMPAES